MFKKILKWTGLLLLTAFIVLQFFRPTKNKSDVISNNDITKLYAVPRDVENILKTSCYNCHSNNTVYPWYAEVQPVAWWLNGHIQNGKKDLNFSEFGTYRIRRQYKKLEEIDDLVKDNKMPLDSYLWIHKNAKLNDDQKKVISNWVTTVRDTIKSKYPVDSLVRKS